MKKNKILAFILSGLVLVLVMNFSTDSVSAKSTNSVKIIKTYKTPTKTYYANADSFFTNRNLTKKDEAFWIPVIGKSAQDGVLSWAFRTFTTNKSEQIIKNGKKSVYRYIKNGSKNKGVWIWRGYLSKKPELKYKHNVSDTNYYGQKKVNTARKLFLKERMALLNVTNDPKAKYAGDVMLGKTAGDFENDYERMDRIMSKATYTYYGNVKKADSRKERQEEVNLLLFHEKVTIKETQEANESVK